MQQIEKHAAQFNIDLPLAATAGKTTLKVSCSFYYCQEGAEGLCKAAAVAWTVPVEVAADAPARWSSFRHAELK